MSGYIGNIPVPQATQTRDTFTATSGQTSFATSGYTPGFLDVYLNGVHLVNGTDYTASNGSDVVLSSGAATDDIVEVLSYSTYEVNAQTYTGGLTTKNDGAAAITANRLTSDGTVINVQKDGTTAGSIGTRSGVVSYVVLDPRVNGAGLTGTTNTIEPTGSSGAPADNVTSLGSVSRRFKDLYLSGGVYLGGTGGENLLDDYEEGTWTPVISFDGASVGTTYVSRYGRYTKTGNLVSLSGYFFLSNKGTSTGSARFDNLPFAAVNETGNYVAATFWASGVTSSGSLQAYVALNQTFAQLQEVSDAGVNTNLSQADFVNNSEVMIQVSYYTSS